MYEKFSIKNIRLRLTQSESLPKLTLMALVTGLLSGSFLILFEELLFFFDAVFQRALISEHIFSPLARFLLPVGGALALILLIKSCPPKRRSFGIAHVIERLTLNRGWLPIKSTLVQFGGILIALVSGFSVGREGPAVHMGAGAGSFLGQILKLPINMLGVLAGCGTAAAIAALFNTPVAGVIFAMEVVMKEYSLESFIPVMTSAVMASVLTQTVYGLSPVFLIPIIPSATPEELMVTAVTAIIIGLLAAAFIQINVFAIQKRQNKVVVPLLIAGLLMGVVAVLVPATMGIGYEMIEALLIGDGLNLQFLFILLATKLVITALVIGLGVPGGMIGPSLMMGATAGACSALLAEQFLGIPASNTTFHVMIGMITMMAAIFQAPFTALITMLELTYSSQIVFPAMLAIVIACLTASQLCKQQGIFAMQFLARGLDVPLSPIAQFLNRIGVTSLMDSRFLSVPPAISMDKAKAVICETTQWLVIKKESQFYILNTVVLFDDEIAPGTSALGSLNSQILQRVGLINSKATAYEALTMMKSSNLESLLVVSGEENEEAAFFPEKSGIINKAMIDKLFDSSGNFADKNAID